MSSTYGSPDGVSMFADFMRMADRLRMHPDERCDILGVSVETWRALSRGTAEPSVLCSERSVRRMRYAIGLMQRELDNRQPDNRMAEGRTPDNRIPAGSPNAEPAG